MLRTAKELLKKHNESKVFVKKKLSKDKEGADHIKKAIGIKKLCEKHGLKNYTVHSDLTVSVKGNVRFNEKMDGKTLKGYLGFSFKEVTGNFKLNYCDKLKTLEGCPEKVGGNFDCFSESLESLKGMPKVEGSIGLEGCASLLSLEGIQKKVDGNFNCNWCGSLKTLEGSPEIVSGIYQCSDCFSIKNLKGSPKKVGSNFNCYNCSDLLTLEGCSKEIGGDLVAYGCKEGIEDTLPNNVKLKGELQC